MLGVKARKEGATAPIGGVAKRWAAWYNEHSILWEDTL